MLDLYNNKYDRETLKANIFSVKLIDILKTQRLDVSFVVRYILQKKYWLVREDAVTVFEVIKFQPHLMYDDIVKEMNEYDNDDDSIVDFETVSNEIKY